MRIATIIAALAGMIYILYSLTRGTTSAMATNAPLAIAQGRMAPIATYPSTPVSGYNPTLFGGLFTKLFGSPSPIIQNGTLQNPSTPQSIRLANGGTVTASPNGTGAFVAQDPLTGENLYANDPGTGYSAAVSPSPILTDYGAPAVSIDNGNLPLTSYADAGTVLDAVPFTDYPGIQPYMNDPYATDPNAVTA